MFDCKWSPNGDAFACTDSHGFLRYFSFGAGEAFKRVPEQVFFHTDYRPLVRDSNNLVLDEKTQMAPYLMPPPFLVDMDGSAHPTKYVTCSTNSITGTHSYILSGTMVFMLRRFQYLVPGREKYKSKYQVPRIGITPSGDREVLDTSTAEVSAFEDPIEAGLQQAWDATADAEAQDRDILDHMIARMQREQDARIVAAGGEPALLSPGSRRNSNPMGSSGRLSTGQPRFDESGDEPLKMAVWTKRTCVQPLHDHFVRLPNSYNATLITGTPALASWVKPSIN